MRFNYLLIFLLGFVIFSCGNPKKEVKTEAKVDFEFIDSDLSQFTPQQIYNQHIIYTIPIDYQLNIDSLVKWIVTNQPGGLKFENWKIQNIQKVHFAIDTLDIIQPFIIDDYWNKTATKPYLYSKANSKLSQSTFTQLFLQSGINIVDFNGENDSIEFDNYAYKILNHYPTKNKLTDYANLLSDLKNSDILMALNATNFDTVDYLKLRETTNFGGLFIVESSNNDVTIQSGADLVFEQNFNASNFKNININSSIEQSTKRILSFKKLLKQAETQKSATALQKYTQLNLQQKATVLLSNKKDLIPIKSIKKQNVKLFTASEIDKIIAKKGTKYIVLPDSLTSTELKLFKSVKSKNQLVICFSNSQFYADLKQLPHLIFIPPVYSIDQSILKQQLLGQISFEGDFVNGSEIIQGIKIKSTKLARTAPEFVGVDSKQLHNVKYLIQNAMNGRAFPGCQVLVAKNGSIIYDQYFGHHSYKREIKVKQNSMYDIASLTKIVSTTLMSMKLYEMGKFNLYDSLEIYFPDSLKNYLNRPSNIRHITFQELLTHKSGLPAGFPILKYMQYTTDEIQRFDKYYCDFQDEFYSTPVAENFYLEDVYQDSMWIEFHKIWINKAKPYKYSDVNMNLMYFLLRSMIENHPKDFDFNDSKKELKGRNLYVEYLYKTFYKPLEMTSTYYQPTKHVSKNRLVPTENESYWRKQLLQGYVHDPNSALHGGIAGNAGIFTTTNDLVKLLQMWLNKGVYDNKRYLKAETIQHFIQTQPESHRGLGFNKRTLTNAAYAMADSASVNTYGHTGFTGTCFWVDPDNQLVYIFLGNRVHPKVNNRMYQYAIRKNVHQVFYDAFLE